MHELHRSASVAQSPSDELTNTNKNDFFGGSFLLLVLWPFLWSRAQLFQVAGCGAGTIRCIRGARLGRPASVAASVHRVRHVHLCAVVCIALYHIHGVCDGNGYHDVHRIRYH